MAINRPVTARTVGRRTLLKAGVGSALALPAFARSTRVQGQTEVRLVGWQSSPAETTLFEQVLSDFESKNPNIAVNFEVIAQQYEVKIQTDLAAGTTGDVIFVNHTYSKDLASRGVLLPLDDMMAGSGMAASDFYPGLIQTFQWQGATYGLPKDQSPLAMLYNTQLFTDADVENPPTTWEELRSAAETLTESLGFPAIVYGPNFDRFIAFLLQAGGGVTNPEGTELTIDSDATTEALEFYYGLYRDGLAATPADAGAEWAGDALAKGVAAIVFEGNWFFPFKEENAPDLQVGIAEMPAGPGGKGSPAFTAAYSIAAGTELTEEAWTLINYLTGPDGMWTWTSLGLAMPSRPDLADRWVEQFPERAPYLATGEYAVGYEFGPGTLRFNEDANAILQALFAGETDVDEAKTQLVQKAQEDLQLTGAATPAA